MVELEVHVVGERIIVNLPGARFTMTFTKDPDSPGIIERSIGPGTIMSLPFRPASVPCESLGSCEREGEGIGMDSLGPLRLGALPFRDLVARAVSFFVCCEGATALG